MDNYMLFNAMDVITYPFHNLISTVLVEQTLEVNTSRSRQNGHYFTDNILKYIFLNKNVGTLIKISLKFVPRGPINNILDSKNGLVPTRQQANIWTNHC